MARKDVNLTVQMDAKTVFIGDICYALDDEIYQEKWGEGLKWADGEIRTGGNGNCGPVCAVVGSTAYGDGCYKGSDGIEYGVDAGNIGVTSLAYRRRDEDHSDEHLMHLGKLVDIPGGKCFVTLIDESGDFYISIEDMKHNKIYSVNIPTGYEEPLTCSECGEEISDFENNRYGGVCESCYREAMYGSDDEEEEDLYECCDAGCTSAEFQRMAPAKNAKMIGMKKKSLGKKNKYNTLGEKRKMSEAFTDEELDMDDDEWLEKMKAQRAAEKQARQAKRDAEEKAKRDAEEREARLARGEYTEEEKRDHIKQNCKLLSQYIQTMEDDLWDAFQEAASPLEVQKGNPVGYDPYTGGSSYESFDTFPMYVNVTADREDDEEVSEYTGHEIDYYDGVCTYYKAFTLDDLKFSFLGPHQEADRFHSGKRNEEAFKKYFVEGTAVFEDIDEIHDTLDLDAELFATVKWLMYESFGCLVAAAAKASSKTIEEAADLFFSTEYAEEAGMANRKEKFFFTQYAGAFYTDEAVESFLNESKVTESVDRTLNENANAQDKVLVRVYIPNDYYDKFGNPVNADKYDERLEEIDKVLFEAGAETVWEVTSDPEAGWEGDDFSDTGFRRMTIAQLQVAIENGGIEEDEIRVYDNDIDVDRDQWTDYMNNHPEIDPWDYTADYDIYEDHRIHDIYSLVFDADDADDDKNPTERPLLQRALQGGYTEEEAKDMAEYIGLDVNDPIGFDDFVKLRDDWLVWTGKADKNA